MTISKILGIDEVGLGPWAGPLCVACCYIDPTLDIFVDDSKKLSPKKREIIFEQMQSYKNHKIFWGVSFVQAKYIDDMGVVKALQTAVHNAFMQCKIPFEPEKILIDGIRDYPLPYPTQTIKNGDSLCAPIAAASIVAKVLRDRYMTHLAKFYPQYGWEANKGYGTEVHKNAILEHGITKHHRRLYLRNLEQSHLLSHQHL